MKKPTVKSGSKSLLARIHARLDRLQSSEKTVGGFSHALSSEDSPTFIRYVVTTGIRAFDDRVGGMPVGKATELCGLPKSGKTNMAVRTCVRAEQGFVFERIENEDGTVRLEQLKPGTFQVTTLYYDIEGSLSDINNRIVDGHVMAQGELAQCELVEDLWRSMDEVMEEVQKEQDETNILQLLIVVIDTVGALTTKLEMDAAWGKTDFPRVPYQLKTGFKAMCARMQRENVMLIGLNHVSRKMNVRGQVAFKGWQYDSPGGMAFSYFATHQVYFEMLQRKYCLRGKGDADGLVIYFLTQKNRMLPMLRQCHLVLLLGVRDKAGKLLQEGGFKDIWSLLEALIFHKAAKVSKETGSVSFRFEKFNIATTTFGPAATTPSLEESDDQAPPPTPTARRMAARPKLADDREKKKKDPRIPNRMAFLEFYEQHKADVEALYERVTEIAMQGSWAVDLPTQGDDDEDDDEAED